MNTIAKNQINDYCVTGEFDIQASTSADLDDKVNGQSVNVTLRFKLVDVPLGDIIASSLKDKRINWQSTARKRIGSITSGQVITVDYRGGRTPVDPKASTKSYLASLSPAERMAWLKEQGLI